MSNLVAEIPDHLRRKSGRDVAPCFAGDKVVEGITNHASAVALENHDSVAIEPGRIAVDPIAMAGACPARSGAEAAGAGFSENARGEILECGYWNVAGFSLVEVVLHVVTADRLRLIGAELVESEICGIIRVPIMAWMGLCRIHVGVVTSDRYRDGMQGARCPRVVACIGGVVLEVTVALFSQFED